MQVSAELRWFWRGAVPGDVDAWFRSGPPPAGGEPREDVYLRDPARPELGIKQRGNEPGVEIKGLVAVRAPSASGPFPGRVELWCKWSSDVLRLRDLPAVTTVKTRWLRKFAASRDAVREIELDRTGQPRNGEPQPRAGCNLELTQVMLRDARQGEWWTLGFEAFGDLESVEQDLRRTMDRLGTGAPGLSGAAQASYPRWLARTLDE